MLSPETVALLGSPRGVRERTGAILELARAGRTRHFAVDTGRLPRVAEQIAKAARDLPAGGHAYGRLRHFDAGGVPRLAELESVLAAREPAERAQAMVDLVVVSVLLDAGAGGAWRYVDGNRAFARSEGLAVASFRAFLSGAFSSERTPRVDAAGLAALDEYVFCTHFQVTARNALVGARGRLRLLHGLGDALRQKQDLFGPAGRPGALVDALRARGGRIRAGELLSLLVEVLSPVWPARDGDVGRLGDVWRYAPLGPGEASLVPFHKLVQWLVHSIAEPLAAGGVELVAADELTALAEYRTGGLLLDLQAVRPRTPATLERPLGPSDEAVVEWRALTVALLAEVEPEVRALLGLGSGAAAAAVIGGAAWAAGRAVAHALRPDGEPPIHIDTDGTVF